MKAVDLQNTRGFDISFTRNLEENLDKSGIQAVHTVLGCTSPKIFTAAL